MFFLTFEGQLHLKHILLRPFLGKILPKMLSKSMVSPETSLRKSKKRAAIALEALGGCRGLGQLWEALGRCGQPRCGHLGVVNLGVVT